jgi:PAS domain S-box-containing protein
MSAARIYALFLRLPLIIRCTVFALVYFAAAELSVLISFSSDIFTTFWPPFGIFISVLVLSRKSLWPWIFLSVFFSDVIFYVINYPQFLMSGVIFFCVDVLTAYAGALLIRRCLGPIINIERLTHSAVFSIVAAGGATFFNAAFCSITIVSLYNVKPATPVFLHWWCAEACGVLLTAPILFSFVTLAQQQLCLKALSKRNFIATVVILGISLLLSAYAFIGHSSWMFDAAMLLICVLFAAGMLLDTFWASLITFCVVIIAVYGTSHNMGEISCNTIPDSNNMLKLLIFQFLAIFPGNILPTIMMRHRDAESRVKKSEERFRTVFEESSLGMAIVTLDHHIVNVNAMYCAITGYTRQELLSMKFDEYTYPDDSRLEELRLKQLLSNTITNFQIQKRYIRKDKKVVWGMLSVSLIHGDSGMPEYMLGQVQDITDTVKAEEELQERTFWLDESQRTAHLGSYKYDLVTKAWTFSETFNEVLGFAPSFPLSIKDIKQCFSPEDTAILQQSISIIVEKQQPFKKEFLATRPDNGRQLWLAIIGKLVIGPNTVPQSIIGTIQDITDRKLAEKTLKDSEELLRFLIQNIQTAILLYDKNGTIVMSNPKAQEILELPGEVMPGHKLHDFGIMFIDANGTYLPQNTSPVQDVIQKNKPIIDKEYGIIFPHWREPKWLFFNVVPTFTGNNELQYILISCIDITEKQKTEESLRGIQKLESLGVLAGGIAHDFNNLLSGMFGYLDLAREFIKQGNVSEAESFLKKAINIFSRARALTHQLLTFSKGGAPIKKTVDMKLLLRETTNFSLTGCNVTPVFNISYDLWLCDIDENQINQVIDNMIINARQAMPSGGIVTVAAHNLSADSPVPLPLVQAEYVVIVISDTGTGILPEHLRRIFEPFFTTKTKGTGLGLATSFSIVSKHGGHITVSSEYGKGTVFTIYLPAKTKWNHNEKIMEPHNSHAGQGRVLIMDDEDYILDVANSMLKKMGYEVVPAHNGTEAVELFKKAVELNEPFAAALLDLTIHGGMGGKQAVQLLHDIIPSCKFIASSGYSDDPIMADPGKYGFDNRLTKPYTPTDLGDALQRLGI